MSVGQLGPSEEADAKNDAVAVAARPTLDRGRARERERLLARVRTDVIPGLEALADPAASPEELIARADRHSRRLRAELEHAGDGNALFDLDDADPACAEERAWMRGHLHDTALQILEFIAGDGFGTGLSAAHIAHLAGGAASDLHLWVDRVEAAVGSELVPELELVTQQARTLDARVELVVGAIGAPPSSEQVEALVGAVREAVNNARKHSNASHVIVRLECDQDGRTAVTVTDDGVGIDIEQLQHSSGLGVKCSIVGRMNRVGGHASLQGAPGGGTRVTLVTQSQGA